MQHFLFFFFSGLDQPAYDYGAGGVGGEQSGQRRSQSVSGALPAGGKTPKENVSTDKHLKIFTTQHFVMFFSRN